jgi:curved DNA-binding protein CbpA
VTEEKFVDHYEILQLSPNATGETVERVYRFLAKRYHPDNQDTGDAVQFAAILTAYELLANPVSRASYDAKYEHNRAITWKIFKQEGSDDSRADDKRLFHGILSLLYIARRRDPENGGLGPVTLETMLGCPQQHLEFPIWYLKKRGFVERMGNGYIAITADGIDKLGSDDLALPADRLITDRSADRTPEPHSSLLLQGATASS